MSWASLPVSHPLDSRRVLKAGTSAVPVPPSVSLTPPRLAESTESAARVRGAGHLHVSHPLDSRRVLKVRTVSGTASTPNSLTPPRLAESTERSPQQRAWSRRARHVSHPLDSRRVLKGQQRPVAIACRVLVSHPLDSRRVLKVIVGGATCFGCLGLTPPRLAESTERVVGVVGWLGHRLGLTPPRLAESTERRRGSGARL